MPAQPQHSIWALVVAIGDAEKELKKSAGLSEDGDEEGEEENEEGEEESEDMPEKNDVGDEELAVEWLDAAFVAESIGEDEESIGELEVRDAVGKGSNYCSTLLRVSSETASGDTIRLIIKALPKGELMINLVTELGFFTREINMLTHVLPALQQIGSSLCGPDSPLAQPLGPRALPCSRPNTLVMEDLSAQGFKNAERRNQLDVPHCKAALSMLARYHALSVALYHEDPEVVEDYGECMFLPGNTESTKHIFRLFSKFGDVLDTWEEMEGTDYAERLRAMADTAYSQLSASVERKEGSPFNVLNHGDFWINNFMFRYDGEDEEEPADIRLVDLQMVRFSSLALDLQYFVNTSVREKIRETQLDDLLEHYRHSFNESLRQLGLEQVEISEEELKQEFQDKSFFGLHAAIGVLCAVVAEPSERIQLDDMTSADVETSDPMNAAWSGKRFRRLIPSLLQHYSHLGVF